MRRLHTPPPKAMKTFPLALAVLVAGCHLDTLLNASGGGRAPPAGARAVRLAFTTPPSNAAANSAITPPVQVSALDAGGNTITSFAGVITIALGTDGSLLHNARLSGGTAAPASGGVATFAGLSIDQLGSGYTLTATLGTGDVAVESAAFNITLVP